MEGLNGVIFVQARALFPLHPDQSLGGAAQHRPLDGGGGAEPRLAPASACSAASSSRWPCRAIIAGASLVFVKVFDDLATPLLLNVKDMLAPQAYLRVTSIGIADPMGYVISVVLIVVSVARDVARRRWRMRGKDYATVQRGGGGLARRTLDAAGRASLAYGVVGLILRWCWRRISACCCCPSRRSGRSARCPTPTRWRITRASSARARSTSRTR